jgi:hypothetical protein
MSDYTLNPRNSIEEELFAKGYRILWDLNNTYSALAPTGQLLTTEHNREDCWTKCYQHNANKKQSHELEELRRENDILRYKIQRYEQFLVEQGYKLGNETIVVCEDEDES